MPQLTRPTGRERRYPVHKDVAGLPSMPASGTLPERRFKVG
ncbi:MAG: hypothetical protein PHY16_03820 [Methylobacter sp.]|nr:hypothetical protein [Methylobacter sp.]